MGKEMKKVFVISLLFTVCKSVLRKKWCGKIHRRLKRCYYGVTIMITTTTITNTSSNTATTITYLSRFYFLFHGLAIRWIQKKKLETRSNFQEFFSSTTTQAWAKQMKKNQKILTSTSSCVQWLWIIFCIEFNEQWAWIFFSFNVFICYSIIYSFIPIVFGERKTNVSLSLSVICLFHESMIHSVGSLINSNRFKMYDLQCRFEIKRTTTKKLW